ncbi:hypothetical protein AMR41_02840 [Hapalosiphon sp. MRB220]|nr:hypothetical protein AMR41_02840 [Hapalosiphon sp. MRB220]
MREVPHRSRWMRVSLAVATLGILIAKNSGTKPDDGLTRSGILKLASKSVAESKYELCDRQTQQEQQR